jgi:hypothetical protein
MDLARFAAPLFIVIVLFFSNDLYVIVFTWVLLNASSLPIDAVN